MRGVAHLAPATDEEVSFITGPKSATTAARSIVSVSRVMRRSISVAAAMKVSPASVGVRPALSEGREPTPARLPARPTDGHRSTDRCQAPMPPGSGIRAAKSRAGSSDRPGLPARPLRPASVHGRHARLRGLGQANSIPGPIREIDGSRRAGPSDWTPEAHEAWRIACHASQGAVIEAGYRQGVKIYRGWPSDARAFHVQDRSTAPASLPISSGRDRPSCLWKSTASSRAVSRRPFRSGVRR